MKVFIRFNILSNGILNAIPNIFVSVANRAFIARSADLGINYLRQLLLRKNMASNL